jgi:drug/metabolite transporter (DMT)-like permease
VEQLNQTSHNKESSTAETGGIGYGVLIPLILIQQTLGALCFPVGRYGLGIIEPFKFAFYRFLLATIVLLGLTKLRKQDPPIERADYGRIVVLGFIIILGNQVMYLWGQSLTAAGHGSVLFATTPIWVMILAAIFLREQLTWKKIVGGSLAVAGAFTIITAGSLKLGAEYLVGDLIILVSVWAWAVYAILGKPLAEKYGALRITAYALSVGALAYAPFGLYRAITFDYSRATTAGWMAIIYFALGSSVASYVIWYWLLKKMTASRLAVYSNIQPILATSVAYFALGERLGLPFFIGGSIVLVGVILTEL